MAKTKKSEGEKITLTVEKRTVFGKKLRTLRNKNIVPANIFGPDFKSTAIQVGHKDFMKVYKQAKETGIVYLQLEKEEIPVLIKHVQYHPVSDLTLHVDLRKIDLKQKVETAVPIQIVGVSEAVSQKGGVLLTQSSSLLVEALPENIPSSIPVDISTLKEIGNEIRVENLPASDAYQIKEDLVKVVASVVAHKEESIAPETTQAPAPEVITEAQPKEEAEAKEQKPEKTEKTAPDKKEKN